MRFISQVRLPIKVLSIDKRYFKIVDYDGSTDSNDWFKNFYTYIRGWVNIMVVKKNSRITEHLTSYSHLLNAIVNWYSAVR